MLLANACAAAADPLIFAPDGTPVIPANGFSCAAAAANALASFVTEAIRDDSTAAWPGVLVLTATPPPAYPMNARPSLTAAIAAWPYRAAESARITHSSFDRAYSPARSSRGPPGPVIRPPAALRPEIPPGYGFVE